MNAPLRIAIAGLGTVGGGTLKILQEQAVMLEARCGRKLDVVAVSARDKAKKRAGDASRLIWVEDAQALAQMPDVDVVVELIGGAEGAAKSLVTSALVAGKHVVTANKALIAQHGVELAKLAEQKKVLLAFEAAVCGGIPIIRSLREGLAANRIHQIMGILNGTCNFILTSMWEHKKDFAWALGEAQAKGYAEADPTFDVDGMDTAHKLAILTSLAYGSAPDTQSIHVEGIRRITTRDLEFVDELGYAVKLLGIATRTEAGNLQRVHPCMVPKLSGLGRAGGACNAVIVEGHAAGRIGFEGPGAGEAPTASSVVADIMDIARGNHYKPFSVAAADLKAPAPASMDTLRTSYYLRLAVLDKPGVLAAVTGILRDKGISLSSFLQHSHTGHDPVQVVLTTHETLELDMKSALHSVAGLDFILEPPHLIRIEALN